jgi:hypothetical protein
MSVKEGWVVISSLSDGVTTSYANSDSVITNGNKVTMWDMLDFNTPQLSGGAKVYSAKKHQEYDCIESKIRIIGFAMFSGNMGRGNVVSSTSSPSALLTRKWVSVEADSTDAALMNFACGNKQVKL